MLIGGEPGIGKTRLLAELCARGPRRGATVLLGPLLRGAARAVRAVRRGARASAGAARRRRSSRATTRARRALAAVRRRRRRAAAAGGAGRARCSTTCTGPTAARCCCSRTSCARRPGRAARRRHLPRQRARRARTRSPARSPTSAATACRAHRARGPRRGRRRRARRAARLGARRARRARCTRETGGNPFFVEEVVRAPARGGRGAGDPRERPRGARPPPVAPRRRRRTRARRRGGRRARASTLALLERLDALAGRRRARRARGGRRGAARCARTARGRAASSSPTRSCARRVYEELSLTRRVRLHGAVADALEALHGDDPRASSELADPPPRGRRRAATRPPPSTSRSRGRARRMRALAYEDAAAHCARARSRRSSAGGGADARRRACSRAARRCCAPATRPPRARRSPPPPRIAREPGDAELLARAALGAQRARRHDHRRRRRRPSRCCEEALAALADDASAARAARSPGSRSRPTTRRRPPQRKALGDEAVAPRPRAGDPARARRRAQRPPRRAVERRRTSTSGSTTAAEMVAAAARAGDAERELQGAQLARRSTCSSAATRRGARGGRAPRAARRPPAAAGLPVVGADVALDARDRSQGRFAEAERLIAAFAAIGARTPTATRALRRDPALRARLDARALRRRRRRAPLEREARPPGRVRLPRGLRLVPRRAAASRRGARARRWVAADDCARLGDDMNRLAALAELAQAIALARDAAPAAGAYDRLAPYADRNVVNARGAGGYGCAELPLGLLADVLGRPTTRARTSRAPSIATAAIGAPAGWAAAARRGARRSRRLDGATRRYRPGACRASAGDAAVRVAVVGPGAIGATFGAVAEAAGHDVVLCGRRAAPAPVVERPDGAEHALASAVLFDPAAADGPVPWVLLAVKAHQTAGAADWLAAMCDAGTTVAVLQNGVEHRALVEPLAGAATVVPSVVWCPSETIAPGRVRQRDDAALMVADDPAGAALAALLEPGGARVDRVADFPVEAWRQAHGQRRRRPHGDHPPARRGLPPRRRRRPRAGLRARMRRRRPGRGRRAARRRGGGGRGAAGRDAGRPRHLDHVRPSRRPADGVGRAQRRRPSPRRPARHPDAGQRRRSSRSSRRSTRRPPEAQAGYSSRRRNQSSPSVSSRPFGARSSSG